MPAKIPNYEYTPPHSRTYCGNGENDKTDVEPDDDRHLSRHGNASIYRNTKQVGNDTA